MAKTVEPPNGRVGDRLDEIIGALADKRRRFVLHDLCSRDRPVALSDVAERLGDWESQHDVRAIQVSLVHNHLPKMESAGLVEFDGETHSVSVTKKGKHANEGRMAYVEHVLAKCS